ncbi:sigma-70 family RNA polymerase sigma factor [Clostridium botulinum]|uniref:RNA polymerase sigma factor, sigma-70 family n=1 Tax=Clostridium botulinum (strain Langeland / NCTC 10281 / Type F) TaxID=441772 RepID=A7GFX5_CLOBL|nr:sigma-70 family RNA polymerase sigma factor [Clostridium botulinum]ABS39720.1 RNA polymerase sigma factor, sigma-70 family [Clostridium botulinum F str. Langeland]ADG00092.1 RNA polymerase sigma factor, sigma-70 family [Clostridium botulinum F str. 230613]KKM42359.1 RNA polymerase sigma 70 [Clostridium botulinum]MBY6793164.1 sigma-70 family RNA polymerase sigma factor [Clostridium botulinum]MBY6937374.1 sigma-70 family RNA polymerase sigma factor [Clostridium botulinum]
MINAEEHLGIVYLITNKRYKQFKHKYSYEDLFQEGCLGLMKAANRFDSSRRIKFSTYAYPYVDGQILRMIESDKWYGKNRKERLEGIVPYSLDAAIDGLDNEIAYIDSIGNYDLNFEKIEIKTLIDSLPEKLKEIMEMYYMQSFTQAEIARKIGCSRSNVTRLKIEALDYLRFQVNSIKKEMA